MDDWNKVDAADQQDGKSARIARPPVVREEPAGDPFQNSSATGEVLELCSHLIKSPRKWKVLLLVGGVIAVLLCNIVGQIYLNLWQRSFFDAIERKDLGQIGQELLVFLSIVAVLLVVVVSQT